MSNVPTYSWQHGREPPKPPKAPRAASPGRKFLIVAAVLLAGYLIWCFAAGTGHTVYVTNGLSRPYEVTVGGTSVVVPPGEVRSISLGEGDYEVNVRGEQVDVPAQRISLRTGFFSRPFKRRTYVLNPDHTALVVEHYASYGTAAPKPPEDRLHLGEALYICDKVDFEFTPFPPQISAERAMVKSGMMIWKATPGVMAYSQVIGLGGMPAARLFVADHVRQEPLDETYLSIAAADDALEFGELIKDRLTWRPVNLAVHRGYQEWSASKRGMAAVEAEYRKMLATEPENTALQYLTGRMVEDRDEARKLFLKASQGNPPQAFAFHAMGYDALAAGDFKGATAAWKEALRLSPKTFEFQWYLAIAHAAAGEFREALAVRDRVATGAQPMERRAYLIDEASLFDQARMGVELDRRVEAEVGELRKEMVKDEGIEQFRAAIAAERAYGRGEISAFERTDAKEMTFRRAISSLKVAEARALLEKADTLRLEEQYLTLAAVAFFTGDKATGEWAVGKAAGYMESAGRDGAKAAKWLRRQKAPTEAEIRNLALTPSDKRVMMAALAQMYPEHRAAAFAVARQMNFDPRFPCLTVKAIVAEK